MYAVKAVKNTAPAFWTDDVLLHLDAVSFVHKRYPYEDALPPVARVWRTPGEGLELTAKGRTGLRGWKWHFFWGQSSTGCGVYNNEQKILFGRY